jgi:DNA (cytosine-5)-methyltransferase 1
MKYLSVCSGIEAASAAWLPLGWEAVGFSEIAPFCNAVLAYHYPEVPNLGDIRGVDGKYKGQFNVLVGGTPCQSFTFAGKRKGLDDERGQLVWEFIRILAACNPEWFVWENVEGVLGIEGGRVFREILTGMVACGYSVSWRVLDGRDFATPQPRRRVFAVGHYGEDWRASAAVLFEPSDDCWDGGGGGESGGGNSVLDERGDFKRKVSRWHRVYSVDGVGATLMAETGGGSGKTGAYRTDIGIRTFTPLECERYMGFPDGYTAIMYKGKPASDTARIKALGNSIIPAKLRWIGKRLEFVDSLIGEVK